MESRQSSTAVSWKKEPYVWMLIGIPLSAIIVGVIMLVLAIQSDTGLVVDDYYKRGKEINRVLARDKNAQAMALQATLKLNIESNELVVIFESTEQIPKTDMLTINFFHSTRQGLDETRMLHYTDNATYRAQLDELAQGRWDVQVATDTWRLLGSFKIPGDYSNIQLSPQGD